MSLILEIVILYLIISIVMTLFNSRKAKKKMNEELQEKMEKYEEVSKEEFLEYNAEDIVEGAAFRVTTKYSNHQEDLHCLSEAEINVYVYDQLMIYCTTKRLNINDFFNRHVKLFEYVPGVFDILGEGKEIYEEAYNYYLKVQEEYNKDIDEVIDEYDEEGDVKNFNDYTKELGELFGYNRITYQMSEYVRNHVDEFFE